jgi:hypothetical protein
MGFCERSGVQPKLKSSGIGITTSLASSRGYFLRMLCRSLLRGVSGDRFPTPFAHPPGKGLTSSTVNVVWALFNLVVGYVLFRTGKVATGEIPGLGVGVALMSVMLSVGFVKRERE